MRTTLLPKVGVRKLFTAVFVSYGSVKKANGDEFATMLLKDVKDHGTIVTDHVWVRVTPSLEELGILHEDDKITFRALVEMYPRRYNDGIWDVGLSKVTHAKRSTWK